MAVGREVLIKSRVLLGGRVNGGVLAGRGRAVMWPGEGIVRGRYVITDLPRGLHARILGAALITGYPEPTRSLPGAHNPFKGTSHRYTRRLELGKNGRLVLEANCKRGPGTIESTFDLNGEVEIPELVAMDPLIETWVPTGPGRIHAHFTASWETEDGDRIIAECVTDYELETEVVLRGRHHRFVSFRTKVDGDRVMKHQRATLFRAFPDHDEGRMPRIDFDTLEQIDRAVEKEALAKS